METNTTLTDGGEEDPWDSVEEDDSDPEWSTVDRSQDRENNQLRWRVALGVTVIGILAFGGSALGIVVTDGPFVVQMAAAIGVMGLAIGVPLVAETYRTQAIQRHHELMRVVRDLDTGSGGPFNSRMRDLIRGLREQHELTEQLLANVPEQRDNMEELIDELSKRNRAIRALLDEEFDTGEDVKTNTEHEPPTKQIISEDEEDGPDETEQTTEQI